MGQRRAMDEVKLYRFIECWEVRSRFKICRLFLIKMIATGGQNQIVNKICLTKMHISIKNLQQSMESIRAKNNIFKAEIISKSCLINKFSRLIKTCNFPKQNAILLQKTKELINKTSSTSVTTKEARQSLTRVHNILK